MKNTINKDKWLTIGILPLMWLAYFILEIATGRITDYYTLFLNFSLIFLFAFTGWIIYIYSNKYINGISTKNVLLTFFLLLVIDQGIKVIINTFFFNEYFEIIPKFLSFNPIINTDGSWLNARFGLGVTFPLLIFINSIALILFVELYRYYLSKGNKSFWADTAFIFITVGALCSLIDKVFYGGSLDFIGISDLFIADIKDIYINMGILFFIMCIYKSGYLSDDDSTSFKDDIEAVLEFFSFIKQDLFKFKK